MEDKVGCIAAVTSCSGWNLDLALFRRRSLLCLGQWLLCAERGVRKFIFEGPLLSLLICAGLDLVDAKSC